MLKIKEMIISIIITVICAICFVLIVEYSLSEELRILKIQEETHLKYIEDNKQIGVK